jgi:hypothetical protein
MKAVIRVCLIAALVAAAGPPAAEAQQPAERTGSISLDTRSQVVDRYRVLVVRDGIVLTPRSGARQAIEVTDEGIAIDGESVSGQELREKLGSDAGLILQLSYAGADELKRAFGPPPAAPAPPASPEPPAAAAPPAFPPPPESPEAPRHGDREWDHSGGKVRFGGTITVEEHERVREVVAIGGSASVRGRVDGDVVTIGGGVHLGPNAVVNGSVTTIGGGIRREPGSEVRGDVVELGVGGPWVFAPLAHTGWFGPDVFSDWFRLMGTALRVALLMLITLVVVAVADRPVSRIAARAGEDPWLSGFVGLAAEILFVPVLVVTIVFLAISIIGIPLLLLVPFALVALLIGVIMGFAGVARRVGRWVVGDERSPFVAAAVGVVLIAAGAILARLIWLLPGPVWPIAATVGLIGLFLEYVAWTVGLGALLLTRFGTQSVTPVAPAWVPPPVPPPTPPVTDLP